MERAKQERSHVSPFCIHTVSARATLRVGRKAPLSGLSQNVLLNNVGVPSPWEVGEGTAWRLACAAAHVALGRGSQLPPAPTSSTGHSSGSPARRQLGAWREVWKGEQNHPRGVRGRWRGSGGARITSCSDD